VRLNQLPRPAGRVGVNGDLAVFEPGFEARGPDDPQFRFAAAMCRLATELELGLLGGRYDDERAEAYAREALMGADGFGALMGADGFGALAALPDAYLATCFGVPHEQVAARRAELGLAALDGGADCRPPRPDSRARTRAREKPTTKGVSMNDTPRLIVADGDDRLRDDLTAQLLADGFAAEPARSAAELCCRAARGPDLLILGELDEPTAALAFLRELRSGDALGSGIDPWLPVLVLSGAAGDWVPLRCFEAGCDDFQRKPVSYLELRARVRAIVRRTSAGTGKSPRRVGALAIDPGALEARYAGTRLGLSRLEFALLCQLASDPLRVFTKREPVA
jgi:DNA-binding response OmpR family regulator